MDKEITKEENPVQPANQVPKEQDNDQMVEEIKDAKDVTKETLDEEQEEIRRSLKQG